MPNEIPYEYGCECCQFMFFGTPNITEEGVVLCGACYDADIALNDTDLADHFQSIDYDPFDALDLDDDVDDDELVFDDSSLHTDEDF